ncbi:TonB-dependent receptor [Sphingobium sp. CFD-1]|uniref:TonB-dependent receptor n=1 Tax=Sphingobium sp. CFD-1 TaxID=2878545 RepID=UPI00214CD810|nr:TonB-dependent receptor [Sphingobium sp. CFD-1]
MKVSWLWRSAALVSPCLMAATGAIAQDTSAQEETAVQQGLRDIVVTARKTTENLQTTPVAVTALDNVALEQRQIASVNQIAEATPSLSVQSGGTGNAALIYLAIRGNAQNSPNSASDSAVGIYVDGVYYGRPMVGNLGLLDLATAEVLRGTQGTLFGRNTTGGALNLTTVQPDGELSGYVRASLGNYKFRSIEGAATLPIQGDQLSLRVAARYGERDGFGKNSVRGVRAAKLDHDFTARATLKWEPDAMPLTVTIGADIMRVKDTYNNFALVGVDPTGAAANLYGAANLAQYIGKNSDFYRTYGNPHGNPNVEDPQNYNRGGGIYGTINYQFGDVALKSITAYRESKTGDGSDLDGTPYDAFAYASDYTQNQFSEELQLSGTSGKLDWIVGAFYFKEKGTESSESFTFQNVDLTPFGMPGATANFAPSARDFSDFRSTSKAVFAQGNYHVTDALRVTAGLRYTWDKRSINRHGGSGITGAPETFFDPSFTPITLPAGGVCGVGPNAGMVPLGPDCNNPVGRSFKYPAWTLGVDYEFGDNKFVYAKTGGAAMAGGFNTRPTLPGFDSYLPEKVKDAEVGFKGDFLDRRVRTNLAGFYVWRNGAQNIVNIFDSATQRISQFAQNAGDVRSYGFEFEGTVLPWENMEITTAVSRLWSKYKAGSFLGVGRNGIIDRSGEAVPQAPKWTFNIAGTQKIPFTGGTVIANLSYAYTSSRNMGQDTPDLTYGTDPLNPLDTQAHRIEIYKAYNRFATLKGYGLVNGRLGVELDNGLEISIWAKNLTKSHYYSSLFNLYTAVGLAGRYQAAPRTFGGTVGFKW